MTKINTGTDNTFIDIIDTEAQDADFDAKVTDAYHKGEAAWENAHPGVPNPATERPSFTDAYDDDCDDGDLLPPSLHREPGEDL